MINSQGIRVLIVDDNEDDYLIVQDFLSDLSTTRFDLHWVDDFDLARIALANGQYDVCLLDYRLGGHTGLELLTNAPDTVPFILLTGNEDREVDVAAAKAGAADYLVKNYLNGPLLERAIRYAIQRKESEKALLQAQRFAQATVDALPDNIAVLDKDGVIIAVNAAWRAFAQANGSTDENHGIGTNYLAVCDSDGTEDGLAVAEGIRAVMTGKQALFSMEYACHLPSEARWHEIRVTRFSDSDSGQVVVAHANITARKQVEIQLLASESNLAKAQEIAHLGSWRLDLEPINGETRPLFWSDEVFRIFGHSPQQGLVSREVFWDAVHPDDRNLVAKSVAQAIHQGQPYSIEHRIVRADGTERIVQEKAEVVCDSSGRAIKLIGTVQDITERKQGEAALRESEERFRAFMDHMPAIAFVKDQEGHYIYLSKAVEEFAQKPVHELLGKTDCEFFSAGSARLLRENDVEVLASGQPKQFEESLELTDGRPDMRLVVKFPFRDASGRQLLAGVSIDIAEQKRAEAERDRFFTMSLDMLAIVGLDGYLKRVNPAFIETLGFTEAELLAMPFRERVHPEDVASTKAAAENLAQGTPTTGLVNRYRAKDGTWRWIEWNSVSVPEEGLIYAAARDITGRKEAEEALRRAHDELEVRVYERTAELAQSNSILQAEIAEHEHAKRVARTQARQQEVVAELGRRALTGIDLNVLFAGALSLVSATVQCEVCSIFELLPDGKDFLVRAAVGLPADLVGRAAVSAEKNSPAGHSLRSGEVVVIKDLLQEAHFTPAPLALEHGVRSSVNILIHSQEIPFGVLFVGSKQLRVFTQDDVHFLEAVANVLATAIESRNVENEIRQLNTDLQRVNEELRVEVMERQVAHSVLQQTAEALEQAKAEAESAREEAEAANRAKSEFLSRMSHELRTPLNAILGFGQLLSAEDLGVRGNEDVGYIMRAGQHLLDLINEVLDIARIEAGRISLSPEPILVYQSVHEVLSMVQPMAALRQIQLLNEVAEQEDLHIFADQQRFRQVLLNLLANAIKYNRDNGKVIVSCQVPASEENTSAEDSARYLRLEVRDTGVGLTAEEMNKLFVPFERLHAARTQIEGTGIGLVLCKGLMEAMGGRIGVESIIGQGSVFWLELPCAENPSISLAKQENLIVDLSAKDVNSSHALYTVLCIEDNLSNLRLIENILIDRPTVTVLSAMQGSVGLDLARQHRPDVILLDLHLPDIHGEEVLRRLRAETETCAIPVVVLSADATPRQVERLLAAGANYYLSKPLNVQQFMQVLNEFLK